MHNGSIILLSESDVCLGCWKDGSTSKYEKNSENDRVPIYMNQVEDEIRSTSTKNESLFTYHSHRHIIRKHEVQMVVHISELGLEKKL